MAPTARAPGFGGSSCNDWPTRPAFGSRICHFPPGTSKWNKIEHRLFSFVSLNWRGKPLESLEVIINLIAGTTTATGLKVYARLDEREYQRGVTVTDQQLAAVNIERDAFHGDWNYT